MVFMVSFFSNHMCMQFLCLCGCTRSCANRREPRHQSTWQMRFKRLDIGCVFSGLAVVTLCTGRSKLASLVLPCALFWFAGVWAKRRKRWRAYCLFHGMWHITTAVVSWYSMTFIVVVPQHDKEPKPGDPQAQLRGGFGR